MNPLLSFHMPSMHSCTVCNQTYKWSVCYDQHKNAKQSNDIKSFFSHWFTLPDYRLINWLKRHRPKQSGSIAGSLSRGFRCGGSVPPTRASVLDTSPGYRLLLRSSTDSPDSNSKTLNNLNKRNRSLISKSRERSHRQGGRWGDTNIGDKNHVTKYIN